MGFEFCFTRTLEPREGCAERSDARGWRGDAALAPQEFPGTAQLFVVGALGWALSSRRRRSCSPVGGGKDAMR